MFKEDYLELIDTGLTLGTDTAGVDIDFEGSFPLTVNGHFVVFAREHNTLRFNCGMCDNQLEFSEAIWRSAEMAQRRRAMEYAVGYFYDNRCRHGGVEDVVESVVGQYIGKAATPDVVNAMENDLKMELGGYG